MEIIHIDLDHIPDEPLSLSLCLGNFDGMHLGHREVLFECTYSGEYEHSILLLLPNEEAIRELPFLQKEVLMGIDDKINFARQNRIERCYVCHCVPSFFALSGQAFIENVLQKLHVKEIFCGEDYTFGYRGAGNIKMLRQFFDVHVLKLLEQNGEKISSTSIRSLIASGDIASAKARLGHPYSLRGKIVQGKRRGTNLGFPTANLELAYPYLLPKSGVYYGIGYVNGLSYIAMINIGNNPTFENKDVTIEAHLIDAPKVDMYGKTIYLDFYGFLREDVHFESVDALIAQLENDKETIIDLMQE